MLTDPCHVMNSWQLEIIRVTGIVMIEAYPPASLRYLFGQARVFIQVVPSHASLFVGHGSESHASDSDGCSSSISYLDYDPLNFRALSRL
jgi:hypothetical protein